MAGRMRRAAQTLPISPRLLKHFAAATLAITTCIAIFADGSTTEAVAETVKKNELRKAEVDMTGSRRQVFSGMKVNTGNRMPADDPGPGDTGGDSSFYQGPTTGPSSAMLGSQQSARPEDFLPGGELAKKARDAAKPRSLTPQELQKLQESSRARTGSAAVN